MVTRQEKEAPKAMPTWTDRWDFEGVSRLPYPDWFPPVHRKPVPAQELRMLPGVSKAIHQGMITMEMFLRGLLRQFGLRVDPTSRGPFRIWVRELANGDTMLPATTEPAGPATATHRRALAGMQRLG